MKAELKTGNLIIVSAVAVASALYGINLPRIPLVYDVVSSCLKTPLWLSLCVAVSSLLMIFCIVSACPYQRHYRFFLFSCSLGCLMTFWGAAYAVDDFHFSVLIPCVIVFLGLICFLSIFFDIPEPEVDETLPDDRLGRRLLYERSAEHVRRMVLERKRHGVTLAVIGEWGMGKSHFITYLAGMLHKPLSETAPSKDSYNGAFHICSVDLWRYDTPDAAIKDIASAVVYAATGYKFSFYNRLRNLLYELLGGMNLGVFSFASSVLNWFSDDSEHSLYSSDIINRYLNFPQSKKAIFLILDNVDRCQRPVLDSLFPLLEKMKSIRGLVVVCGIAQSQMAARNGESPAAFLQAQGNANKLYDLTIHIMPPEEADIRDYWIQSVDARDKDEQCVYLRRWARECSLRFDTPRQIDRLAEKLYQVDRTYFDRFDPNNRDNGHIWGERKQLQRKMSMILYVESLRLFYSDIIDKLLKMPLINQQLSPEIVEGMIKERGWDALLISVMQELVPLAEEPDFLLWLLRGEYTRFANLTAAECESVIIDFHAATSKDLLQCLRTRYYNGQAVSAAYPLYISVMVYAARNCGTKNPAREMLELAMEDLSRIRGNPELSALVPLLNSSLLLVPLVRAHRAFAKNNRSGVVLALLNKLVPHLYPSVIALLLTFVRHLAVRTVTPMQEFWKPTPADVREEDLRSLCALQGSERELEKLRHSCYRALVHAILYAPEEFRTVNYCLSLLTPEGLNLSLGMYDALAPVCGRRKSVWEDAEAVLESMERYMDDWSEEDGMHVKNFYFLSLSLGLADAMLASDTQTEWSSKKAKMTTLSLKKRLLRIKELHESFDSVYRSENCTAVNREIIIKFRRAFIRRIKELIGHIKKMKIDDEEQA